MLLFDIRLLPQSYSRLSYLSIRMSPFQTRKVNVSLYFAASAQLVALQYKSLVMFVPLKLLFRIGGLFPKSNGNDKIFSYSVLSLLVIYLITWPPYALTYHQGLHSLAVYIASKQFYCAQGIWTIVAFIKSRHQFVTLSRSILSTEEPLNRTYTRISEIAHFLTFCIALIARVVLKSIAHGEVTVLHDTVMCILYLPQMLHSVLVFHLMAKFESLNVRLEMLAEDVRNHASSTSELRDNLLSVFRSHTIARELKSRMVLHLAIPTICIYVNHVAYFTVTTYRFVIAITDSTVLDDFEEIPAIVCVVVTFFVLCDVCHRCAEKVIVFLITIILNCIF